MNQDIYLSVICVERLSIFLLLAFLLLINQVNKSSERMIFCQFMACFTGNFCVGINGLQKSNSEY